MYLLIISCLDGRELKQANNSCYTFPGGAHYRNSLNMCEKLTIRTRQKPHLNIGNWIHRPQNGHSRKKNFFHRWLNIFEGHIQKISVKLKN